MNTTEELELARRLELAASELDRAAGHEETLRLTRDQIDALEATAELSRRARDASLLTLDRLGIPRKRVLDYVLSSRSTTENLLLADVATTVVDAGTVNRVSGARGDEISEQDVDGAPVSTITALLRRLRDVADPGAHAFRVILPDQAFHERDGVAVGYRRLPSGNVELTLEETRLVTADTAEDVVFADARLGWKIVRVLIRRMRDAAHPRDHDPKLPFGQWIADAELEAVDEVDLELRVDHEAEHGRVHVLTIRSAT